MAGPRHHKRLDRLAPALVGDPDHGRLGDGRVLPIGGLKQKLLAAHRAGITEVLIPARNEPDLDDVPEKVRSALQVHLVSDVRDVLDLALEPAQAARLAA